MAGSVTLPLPPRVDGAPLQPRLKDILSASGALRVTDVNRALATAERVDKRVDQAPIDLGLLSEAVLDRLAGEMDVASFDLRAVPQEPVQAVALPSTFLAAARILPLDDDGTSLTLAMVAPYDDFTAKAVALKTGRPVRRIRISAPVFERVFFQIYGIAAAGPAVTADSRARRG